MWDLGLPFNLHFLFGVLVERGSVLLCPLFLSELVARVDGRLPVVLLYSTQPVEETPGRGRWGDASGLRLCGNRMASWPMGLGVLGTDIKA